MAMRRSRIKMAPNLGAKARGPAAAAGTPRAVVKVEANTDDQSMECTSVPTQAATALTSIKPLAVVNIEQLTTSPRPVTENNTKVEPAEKAVVQCPVVQEIPVVVEQYEDSANIVSAEVLKGVSKITAITEVGAVEVARDGIEQLSAEQERDVNRPGTVPPRIRNRFPKAKPNLTETGRGRIRHNSVSRSDDEEMRSPPAIQRAITRPRQPSISESIPSPQKPPAAQEEQIKMAAQPALPSAPEPPPPKVTKVPNNNNSLGIDLGYNTKRVKIEKDDENRRKPRKQERIEGPIDKTKITMRDLIHMNPISNPMKATIAEKERRRKARERQRMRNGEGGDTDDAQSMVSTATLQEEREERAALDVNDVADDSADQTDAATKPEPDADELSAVPQVRIGANGEIILNESSLFIDNKDPDQDSKAASMELIHESDFSIPSVAYGRKTASRLWTEMETKKFYLALSAVGTDFSLMINLFPKRTRTELKRKFKREEKSNRFLVDRAIREQQHFDQEFFDNLAKLEIEEPVPKRRRKESKVEDDSRENRENQENQAEFVEPGNKKKAPAKVKEEKEGEKAEGAKKKRGRKPKEPKEPKGDDDTPEDAENPTEKPKRPKRARKKRVLSYAESDEGNTADEATVEKAKTTEPVAGCSNEAEDPQSNAASTVNLPDGLKLSKPKRKRKQKAGKNKKDEDVPVTDPEPAVDLTELSDLIETNDKEAEEPQGASYVFVESQPRPDDPDGSTEPVIHVYLVSPPAVSNTQHPLGTDKVSHHPTPSPPSSPLRSPPHTPAALADHFDSSTDKPRKTTEGVAVKKTGKVTEATDIDKTSKTTEASDIEKPGKATDPTVIDKPGKAMKSTVIDKPKRTAETNVTDKSGEETESTIIDKPKKVAESTVIDIPVERTECGVEGTTVTDVAIESTSNVVASVSDVRESDVTANKDSIVELTANNVQTLDTVTQICTSSSNVTATDDISPDDIVVTNANKTAQNPLQPVNKIKEAASLSAPPTLRQSESESTSTKASESSNVKPPESTSSKTSESINSKTANDITNSTKSMQSNPSTENTCATSAATSDKPAAMTGRRRRITAMPKIPVGKRRPGGPVSVARQAPQPSSKPADAEGDDSAVPPMDDLTAGGILLEMSNSTQGN